MIHCVKCVAWDHVIFICKIPSLKTQRVNQCYKQDMVMESLNQFEEYDALVPWSTGKAGIYSQIASMLITAPVNS